MSPGSEDRGGRRMLVVGAHSADFVWRAAGAVARHTAAGGEALVVALSYGERGESGELWKDPEQTVENVKRIRHAEPAQAAAALGARFQALDLGDYPLRISDDALDRRAELRDLRPPVPPVARPTHRGGPLRGDRQRDPPVLSSARARIEWEAALRERLRAGELSYQIYGLRAQDGR